MPEPDAPLIAAAQASDRRVIDELLARSEQRIYRFGLRMCGDEEFAREVVQETMFGAFRNPPGFRPARSGLWPECSVNPSAPRLVIHLEISEALPLFDGQDRYRKTCTLGCQPRLPDHGNCPVPVLW